MLSVFSNYLKQRIVANTKELTDIDKPSKVYSRLRIAYNQGAKWMLETPYLFGPIDENSDAIYEFCKNPDLRKINKWVVERILINIGKQSYQTIDVNLRIFTNMLNKLVDNKKLSKKVSIDIHLYLINLVKTEHSLVVTEELPF